LACFTKGDILDQGHKLDRSGLRPFFDYIDIVPDKTPAAYSELFGMLGVGTEAILSVGNSFKSDIAPVLEMGGAGIYIPARDTWQLEKTNEYDHARLVRLEKFTDITTSLL
jgi:putative hydrolase of the HAD superfamily